MSDARQLAVRVAEKLHAGERTSTAYDIKLVDAGVGYARALMVVTEEMLNGLEVCHGGVIFLLADTAFAWACNSRNVATFAQAGSISFISMAQKGETLIAEAREEASEGRTGVYVVSVKSGSRVVAMFQGLSRTKGGAVVEE